MRIVFEAPRHSEMVSHRYTSIASKARISPITLSFTDWVYFPQIIGYGSVGGWDEQYLKC